MNNQSQYIAFDGMTRLAHGTLSQVTQAVRSRIAASPTASILTFDVVTGQQKDLDLRDTAGEDDDDSSPPSPGPGRPKLGVVGREVTLLPRHWEWLNSQPGGASVALRKLVETARRDHAERDNMRARHEAAYKFMSAIAGNLPGYEEALRSLFANDQAGMANHIQNWPPDVRDLAMQLAFQLEDESQPSLAAH